MSATRLGAPAFWVQQLVLVAIERKVCAKVRPDAPTAPRSPACPPRTRNAPHPETAPLSGVAQNPPALAGGFFKLGLVELPGQGQDLSVLACQGPWNTDAGTGIGAAGTNVATEM